MLRDDAILIFIQDMFFQEFDWGAHLFLLKKPANQKVFALGQWNFASNISINTQIQWKEVQSAVMLRDGAILIFIQDMFF